MIQAQGGDQAAFRRFYDQCAPCILAFLMRLLRDRFLAEDVLQEAMVTAWHKASEFDPRRAAAKTWITTIARRRALDVLRSGQRYDTVLRDQAPDIRDAFDLNNSDSSNAADESAATAQRLATCFRTLQTNAAQCIKLAYLEGFTFSEIAARTQHSLNTVKSWVRRGMARLQGCMQR